MTTTDEELKMESQVDRDDYRLRVLIEQLQQAGRTEHEIERAVREASGRIGREHRPARRSGRSRLLDRLLPV
jgi:hypothetical protein